MRRIKYLLLVSLLACTIGCQKNNTIVVPVDNNDKNTEEEIVEEIVEDIADDIEVVDTEKEEQDEFVSAFEVGSPEYLFEQFLIGEIDAEILYSTDTDEKTKINVSNLNMDPEEWSFDSFSVGEQLDLDNDGENELILDGPYGGMYLDAIDGNLYVFARALGNAGTLDYTYYDGAYWIVIKDTTHAGRLYYALYKYEGGDNLVDSMLLLGEFKSENDKNFTFNEEQITEEEFYKKKEELFASKTPVNRTNCYDLSEEEFFKLLSYMVFLEDYEYLPEDTKSYEVVHCLGEKVDSSSFSSDDYRMNSVSNRMLTSDLNIFFKEVLQTDKKFDAGYESISEAGIICKDDGYTYAYNGVGWGEYAVVKNVTKKSDSVEIEAVIMDAISDSLVNTIKFSLIESDNIFGYTIDRDSISIQ